MTQTLQIGFVSPGPATWPHYDGFMKLVPSFVKFDFQGLGLFGQSLYEIIGKKQEIVRRVVRSRRRKELACRHPHRRTHRGDESRAI